MLGPDERQDVGQWVPGAAIGGTETPQLEKGAAEKTTHMLRYDVLGGFAKLAAEGQFSIPIARSFPLEEWRRALDILLTGNARGKLLLLPLWRRYDDSWS